MPPQEPPKHRAQSADHATVLVIGTALATLSSAIVPIVVVRLLGKADVASLLALLLIYDTVALFFTSGFPQTLMYHLASEEIAARRAIVYRSVGLLASMGALAGMLLSSIAFAGDMGLRWITSDDATSLRPLTVFALLPLADLPSRLLPNLLVTEGRARSVAAIGVLRALTNSLAVLVPVALGLGVWAVAFCYVGVGVLRGAGLLTYFLRSLYRDVPRHPCHLRRRELIKFAFPLGATDMVSLLNQQVDRYLILFAFPAASFAVYQAGAWQVPVVTDLPYQVGTAYAPRYAELFKSGKPKEAIELWRGTIKKVSLIVVPVMTVFVIAAEEFIELLFTSEYLGAAPIFRLYSVLTLGRVAAFGTMIVAAGRPYLILRAATVSFAANIILSVPLVLTVGFIGPALGTALAFVPMVIAYCWYISKASTVPFRNIFPLVTVARVAAVVAVASIPAILFKWMIHPEPLPGLLGVAALLLTGFAVLGNATKLIAPEDWHFILSKVRLRRAHG